MLVGAHSIFFLLGLGVLAIAYRFRLTSIGMLAISLIGIGYWSGWNHLYLDRDLSVIDSIALQMPIVAAILFLPLAYRCRSQKLFVLSAIAVCSALLSSLAAIVTEASVLPFLLLILPAALLWSYDDALLGQKKRFQPIARSLAMLYLGGVFYWFSFYWAWGSYGWHSRILEWRSLPSVGVFSAIAIAQWLYLLIWSRSWKTAMIGSMIVVSMSVHFWHLRVQPLPVFAPIVFNAMLALFAIAAIHNSLQTRKRRAFWFGVMLLILQFGSRVSEYKINLLIFELCGVGAIAAGLWFEYRIRALPTAIRAYKIEKESSIAAPAPD